MDEIAPITIINRQLMKIIDCLYDITIVTDICIIVYFCVTLL
jgi:hypothetical protein